MSYLVHLDDLVKEADEQIFLIIGPPGAGKELFAIQYILDGLNQKQDGVYVTTDDFPDDVIKKMIQMGGDPNANIRNKQLQFIDAFSYRTGESVDREKFEVDNVRDLTGLSVMVKGQIDNKNKLRLVINTVSTLSIYNTSIALLDFIQMQVARLKKKNHSGLFIVHEGMIDEKVLQGIKAIVDGVLEFLPSEDDKGVLQRRLRVVYSPKIRKSGWVPLYQ
jgi:circadian clock protein KaiC